MIFIYHGRKCFNYFTRKCFALITQLAQAGDEQLAKKKKQEGTEEKKLPRILDGKFYSVVGEVGAPNEKGQILIDVLCHACNETRRGSTTSTGNFKTHYKLKHPDKFKDLEKYLNTGLMGNSSNLRQPPLEEVIQTHPSNDVCI